MAASPSLLVMKNVAEAVASRWECTSLAVELGLDNTFVGKLTKQAFNDEMAFNVLQKWRAVKGTDATGQALYTALKRIGRSDVAQQYVVELRG